MNSFSHISINPFALLVLLALVWAGCDSTDPADEEPTDVDVFIGTWTVTQVGLNGSTDWSPLVLAQFSEIGASFDAEGDFQGLAVEAEDGEPHEIDADYSVNKGAEGTGTITFTGDEFEETVTLNYTIENNNRIILAAEDATFLTAFAGISPDNFPVEIDSFSLVLSRES